MYYIIRQNVIPVNNTTHTFLTFLRSQLIYGYGVEIILGYVLTDRTAEHAMRILEKICSMDIFGKWYIGMTVGVYGMEKQLFCGSGEDINGCLEGMKHLNGLVVIPFLEGLFYRVFLCYLFRKLWMRETLVCFLSSFYYVCVQVFQFINLEKRMMEQITTLTDKEQIDKYEVALNRLRKHTVVSAYYYFILGINLYFLYVALGFKKSVMFGQLNNFIYSTGLIGLIHIYFLIMN